jgi:hypothetical protein
MARRAVSSRPTIRKGAGEIEGWPRLMTAATAAAYCDEASVDAFRRSIGKIWPRPRKIMGKGERWLREDLDQSIDVLTMRGVKDAADVL